MVLCWSVNVDMSRALQLRFLIVPELLEWFLCVPWLFCLEACGRMGQACLALLRNVAVP